MLLKKKIDLFKSQLDQILTHFDEASRLTPEQVRRLIKYSEQTFFKHVRLYDYVLKNTKLCEKKYINLPIAEPSSGENLNAAMVIEDK